MSKLQIYTVSAALLLFLTLLFGFNTKPGKQETIEKARALQAESTDINSLLAEAKANLSEREATTILLMEQGLGKASGDAAKIQELEQLSRQWFDLGYPEISGNYAERLAEISGTDEAWSICGSTYYIGLQRAKSEKVRTYCHGRAVQAFQNAISINPENIAHQINLALCYTEIPPKDNPMKGILMLVDLNKKNPDNVPVLTQLGRLGIQTGQYAKAVQRLEKAVALDPDNTRAHCLLADAYRGLGNEVKEAESRAKCVK